MSAGKWTPDEWLQVDMRAQKGRYAERMRKHETARDAILESNRFCAGRLATGGHRQRLRF
jgi:hypothetical protein